MEDNLTEKSIEQKQSVPWEQRKEKGLLKALWETTKEVLFHLEEFFDKLVGVESFSAAFWFYVVINIPSVNYVQSLVNKENRNDLNVIPLSIIQRDNYAFLRGRNRGMIIVLDHAVIDHITTNEIDELVTEFKLNNLIKAEFEYKLHY